VSPGARVWIEILSLVCRNYDKNCSPRTRRMLNCNNSYSLLTRILEQELQSRIEAKDRELAEVQQQLRQREEQSARERREMRREIEAELRMTIRREEEEDREPVLQRLRNAISLDDIKEKVIGVMSTSCRIQMQ
jgi:hypothetical protein